MVYDLVIVGGGPSGLSAAINGASEGLSVLVLDTGPVLGGQARESSAIENFPGFADGITGEALTSAMVRQAMRFGCATAVPAQAVRLGVQNDDPRDMPVYRIDDDHGTFYLARTVLLANGLSYRRHPASGLGQFMGRGCWYGMSPGGRPTEKCEVAVVGGANSAGQAVLHLAKNRKAHIRLLVRRKLADQMSQYLIDRIRATPNIEVCENCELLETEGAGRLEAVQVRTDDVVARLPMDYLFIYIGAVPRTWWLAGSGIELDPKGFIVTDNGLAPDKFGHQMALPYETSLPGVFAAGDIRSGSVKRIASAVGEGAQALQMIHRRLGE
jgi:thioredoxin reductase (NADPH)